MTCRFAGPSTRATQPIAQIYPGSGASSALKYCVVRGRGRTIFGMGRNSQLARITVDPAMCHGQPTIRGTRQTVSNILELLAGGMTPEEILADYDDLEREDIQAVLEYAARLATRTEVPLGAA